ncbi:MAG: RidA family protein [Hydrotalea sp.]|nr:RidA family protein [Hydrotalea sp.]
MTDSNNIDAKLAELGITLPTPTKPVAAYVPFVITGNLLFLSGQLNMRDGKVVQTGVVGRDATVDDAIAAAKLCAVNILAQTKSALGDLARVKKIVKLGGFVASTHDFTDQPKIINGASELMQAVFGDAGQHARFAVGVASLPLNAVVEIDAVIEFK